MGKFLRCQESKESDHEHSIADLTVRPTTTFIVELLTEVQLSSTAAFSAYLTLWRAPLKTPLWKKIYSYENDKKPEKYEFLEVTGV